MPDSSDDILGQARTLVAEQNKIGLPTANIYVDPQVQPISTDSNKGMMVLEKDQYCMNYLKGVRSGAIES